VSVVVPFAGDERDAARLRSQLGALERGPQDELIVADNTAEGVAGPALAGMATVVRAARERSSYHARNAGAARATGEWILFLDADCAPQADLLERYFDPWPSDGSGLLAGSLIDHPDHAALLARYTTSRNFYVGRDGLQGSDSDYAPTGNLMVRRVAFEQAGGFVEGIRSAGDVDLCWRLQRLGWRFERRAAAIAAHRHRQDLRSFLSMVARYGAGANWLNRRYPGTSPRWPLSPYELGRSAVDAARHAALGRREEAAFRLVDALGLIAHNVGYRQSNAVGT
jgi:glycosyltransferase involved in cell wall biosynthesis